AMSTPHKCPACDGYGERSNPERWNLHPMSTAIPPLTIACNACGGTGIIWEVAPVEMPRLQADALEEVDFLVREYAASDEDMTTGAAQMSAVVSLYVRRWAALCGFLEPNPPEKPDS